MTTTVLSAHVPLSLAEKVDQVATRLDRLRGWIMKQALTAWIDQEEERKKLTLEALADVEPVRSLVTKPFRLGRTVLNQTSRCRYRTNGIEVDR